MGKEAYLRPEAYESQTKQAERMLKRSKVVLQGGNPGDNVIIPIPSGHQTSDRRRIDVSMWSVGRRPHFDHYQTYSVDA